MDPRTARRCRLLVCLLPFLAVARPAQADLFDEVQGARSRAMGGAHRGLANGNEAVTLNPGGLPLSQRYSVEMQYDYGSDDRLQHGTGSVVDSKTGPVTAGARYTRDWGNPSGVDPTLNRTYGAVAYSLARQLGFGLTLGNVRGHYRQDGLERAVSGWDTTLGLAAQLGGLLGLGAVWHNAWHTGEVRLHSPALGFGASTQLSLLTLAADLVVDLRPDIRKNLAYHAGAEIFLFDVLALRGGWKLTPTEPARSGPPQHSVSGGIGLINQAMGLNFTAESTVGRAIVPRRAMLASIQLFL